jgi:hypothetical protein
MITSVNTLYFNYKKEQLIKLSVNLAEKNNISKESL